MDPELTASAWVRFSELLNPEQVAHSLSRAWSDSGTHLAGDGMALCEAEACG